jgi:hypothetical protein
MLILIRFRLFKSNVYKEKFFMHQLKTQDTKEDAIEVIARELQDLVDQVLLKSDVVKLMKLIRKL